MLLDGRRDDISKFQSKEIEGKPDCREETYQVTTKLRKCRNCGGSHNHTSSCPAKGQERYYCGKSNHFTNICRGKSKDSHKPQKPQYRKTASSKPNTNIRQLAHLESEFENEEYLYPVCSKQTARARARITVLVHSFEIMVDTGASINVHDRKTFSKMVDVTLARTSTKAFPYNSLQPVQLIGKFQALVQTNKRYTVAIFFVVEDDNSGNLMSEQTAQELGLISFHLNKLSAQKSPRKTPTLPDTKDKDLIKILEQNKETFDGLGKLKGHKIILNINETI